MGTKVDGAISTLIQGISQQAPVDRLEGQAELLENFSCDPEKGLIRRAPVERIGELTDAQDMRFYDIIIDNRHAIMGIKGGDVYCGFIDEVDEGQHLVKLEIDTKVKEYLEGGDIRVLPAQDKVYIVNRNVTVEMEDYTGAYTKGAGIVFLLGGQYGRTYTVRLTDSSGTYAASYTTPDGSKSEHGAAVSTTAIAENIVSAILNAKVSTTRNELDVKASKETYENSYGFEAYRYWFFKAGQTMQVPNHTLGKIEVYANGTLVSHSEYSETATSITFNKDRVLRSNFPKATYYTKIVTWLDVEQQNSLSDRYYVTRESDVILFTSKVPTDESIDIEVEDGDGGANIFAFSDTVGDVGRLSRFAPDGYVVKVRGVAGDTADDYFLKFTQEKPGFGLEGYWTECASPEVKYSIDKGTMPHVLTYKGGQFEINRADWKDRRVGDDETNPVPSFIGGTIRDINVFQSRLVLLSGSNVIMSRSSDKEDFWMNSATGIIDSDPIDISSSTAKIEPVMEYAIPHNRDLIIFSKYAQFIVFGRNALTPANTSLVLTTTYDTDTAESPAASGKNVFYPINYGKFTGIKEFYTEGSVDVNASRPITSHCTQYISGQIAGMTSSTTFDLLLVRTNTSSKKLYVYEYMWLNEEKVQSAWSSWTFPWDVVYTFFIEQKVYFVYQFNDKYELGFMDLAREDDTGYQVCLDNKVYIQNVDTHFSKPYEYPDLVFIQGEGCPNPGLAVPVASVEGSIVELKRDMNGGTVIMGIPYMSRYIPSYPIIKDRNDNPITTGRLIVQSYRLTYTDSGSFDVKITSRYMDDVNMHFSGKFLNSPTLLIGKPVIDSGNFDIPFMNDVKEAKLEISCSEPTPIRLNRIEYIGNYIKKGSRL